MLTHKKMDRSMMMLSVTKFVPCAIYHRKMDAAGHFIFKTLPQCYSRFVAYLIKDNALMICVVRR